MPNSHMQIAGRRIGPGEPVYVIAEVGINHGGDPDLAIRLVDAAAEAGADAVKLQVFKTSLFLARSSAYFDVLESSELGSETVRALARRAAQLGVTLFASCFDEPSADLLMRIDAPAFKVASGDLTHLPLLRHIAAFGRPMIVSTGAATMPEISAALEAIATARPETPVALLHCVSNYPTSPEDANLACMATMRDRFGCPVGFSDHTLDNTTAIAAAALGADMIERHFTLDRAMPGPDHALSADPAAFRALVDAVRIARASIGSPNKAPVEAADFIPLIRRSITAATDIPSGTVLTREMVHVKRPGGGIQPGDLGRLIGRPTRHALAADQTITWEDVA